MTTSELWTKVLDRFTLHQGQAKWVLLCVCGLAFLGGAAGLVLYFASPSEPPDPMAGSIDEAAAYVDSDGFLSANSKQRGEYVNGLMRRFRKMSPSEQQEAQEKFGSLFRKDRQARKSFWLAYAQSQSEEYSKLSPEQRLKRIDTFLMMGEAMQGRGQAQREYQEKAPGASRTMTQEQKEQAVDRFRQNVPFLLKQTTARDRAKMVLMARDMMARAKERYGQRR